MRIVVTGDYPGPREPGCPTRVHVREEAGRRNMWGDSETPRCCPGAGGGAAGPGATAEGPRELEKAGVPQSLEGTSPERTSDPQNCEG